MNKQGDETKKSVITIETSEENALLAGGALPKDITITIGTLNISLTINSVSEEVKPPVSDWVDQPHNFDKFAEAMKLLRQLSDDKG